MMYLFFSLSRSLALSRENMEALPGLEDAERLD